MKVTTKPCNCQYLIDYLRIIQTMIWSIRNLVCYFHRNVQVNRSGESLSLSSNAWLTTGSSQNSIKEFGKICFLSISWIECWSWKSISLNTRYSSYNPLNCENNIGDLIKQNESHGPPSPRPKWVFR